MSKANAAGADEEGDLDGPEPATGTGTGTGTLASPSQTPLFRAMNASRYQRQDLIKHIESATGRPLICLLFGRETAIERGHFPAVADLVYKLKTGCDFDVMLHTLGGDLDTAAKIALLLRRTAGDTGHMRVIVPDYAKSAGTLIAVAGDVISMSDTSELGPIDPQVSLALPDGSRARRPAQAYLDAYDAVLAQAKAATLAAKGAPNGAAPVPPSGQRSAPAPDDAWIWQTLLNQFEPALVDMSRNALERSRRYAGQILHEGMFRDAGAWTQAASVLNDNQRWLTHGAVIDARTAKTEVGLNIDIRRREDPLWQAWWQLYCIQRSELGGDHALFESNFASLQW